MIIIIQKEVSLAARLSYNAGGKHLAVGRRSSNSEMFTEVREAQAFGFRAGDGYRLHRIPREFCSNGDAVIVVMSQRANGAVPGPTHSAPNPESKDQTLQSASLIFSTRFNPAETNDGAKAVAARLLGALTTDVVNEVNCLWSKVLEFCKIDNVHATRLAPFYSGACTGALISVGVTTFTVSP